MRLRCMTKTESGWKEEKPDDVSKWMWRHDGTESVVIDETNKAAKVYYCSLPSMMDSYREAWGGENKPNDKRRADTFYALDQILYQQEVTNGMP